MLALRHYICIVRLVRYRFQRLYYSLSKQSPFIIHHSQVMECLFILPACCTFTAIQMIWEVFPLYNEWVLETLTVERFPFLLLQNYDPVVASFHWILDHLLKVFLLVSLIRFTFFPLQSSISLLVQFDTPQRANSFLDIIETQSFRLQLYALLIPSCLRVFSDIRSSSLVESQLVVCYDSSFSVRSLCLLMDVFCNATSEPSNCCVPKTYADLRRWRHGYHL